MAGRALNAGDRIVLTKPLLDGYAGGGRVLSITFDLVRFVRDDNQRECVAMRSEVRRLPASSRYKPSDEV